MQDSVASIGGVVDSFIGDTIPSELKLGGANYWYVELREISLNPKYPKIIWILHIF